MKQSIPDRALPLIWALLWFSLPLSMRATVLFLWLFGLVLLVRLIKNGFPRTSKTQLISLGLFILFLLAQIVSLVADNDHELWWKSLEKKSALLVVPALLAAVDQKKFKLASWAVGGFISGLSIAGIFMITVAALRSFNGDWKSAWSYHDFADPLKIGAIYLSWYFSAALIYLSSSFSNDLKPGYRYPLILFFLLILLLLASKLFIILTIPFVIVALVLKVPALKHKYVILFFLIGLLTLASAPFLNRLSELTQTELKVLKQDTFTYDTPFNGITFRLLQWRLAAEILDNESAWLTGVGINSSQQLLDETYMAKGIYTGNPDLGDRGYLGYNYHNQYLESLVSTGIFGLLSLLLIILNIFFGRKDKLLFPLYVYIITTLFFFTESVLDRQSGIIFFCLIVFTFAENLNTLYGSHTDET